MHIAYKNLLLGIEVLECKVIKNIGKIDFGIDSAPRIYSDIIEDKICREGEIFSSKIQ